MFKKIAAILLCIFSVMACGQTAAPLSPSAKKEPNPVPQQLLQENIAFVSPDGRDEWTIDCGGVWVAWNLILTANHCTIRARVSTMTMEERLLARETGVLPSSVGAELYFATEEQFDVLEKGASKHYNAVVVATDPKHDLALIKAFDTNMKHRTVKFSTEPVSLGDELIIVGHPAGVSFSLTYGHVSGFHSNIDQEALKITGPFLKVNAIIVGGNSGGGAFTSNGEFVGIVSFTDVKALQQGFIIPLGSIKKLLEDYENNKKKEDLAATRHVITL